MNYTLNVNGRLMDLSHPQVMGILNCTPDSFYAASRMQTEKEIASRANLIIMEGGTIIDVGAYSTRPGATPVDEEEEMKRLRFALTAVRREQPDAVVSVDTFRPNVARMAVEEFGVGMINDVSGGNPAGAFGSTKSPEAQEKDVLDEEIPSIFRMVVQLGVPYILMSSASSVPDMMLAFARQVQQLRSLGQKDIILDPGFGFGKTMEQNYEVMGALDRLLVMELPLLVGVSRKSMLWKLLDSSPEESLHGTTALHTVARMKGASSLRVHDVKVAVETVKVACALGEKN